MAKWDYNFNFEDDGFLNMYDSQFAKVIERNAKGGVYIEFETGERAFAPGAIGACVGDTVLATIRRRADKNNRTPFHQASIDSVLCAAA